MNYVNHINDIRDTMQREIIYKVVSNAIESDRTLEFNDPQEFPTEDDSGFPTKITVVGVDCNTGKVYDDNNNVINYQEIPVEVLSVIHYIVVISNEFMFKPIMFI